MSELVVAVTGATGTVGRHVVQELARSRRAGLTVRPLSRSAGDGRSSPWTRFSFTDPTTWEGAFAGAQALFLVRPPELVRADRDVIPALAAARDHGVARVVVLSVLGAEKNPLLPHRRIERWLESSGMATTSLRAGNFMQNLAEVHAADIRDRDELAVPAGDATMSYVDARDVAAAAARCLLDEVPRRGGWDITGPEAITHHDVAAALGAALDRPIRYTRPSLPRYWVRAHRSGMSAGLVAATSVLYTLARCGIGRRTSSDVVTVLGRSPRDIHTFATDHRHAWLPGPAMEGDQHL